MAKTKRLQMVEETRAKLIKAAREAFAADGYAKASMDALTAEVGLTRGALYHNFGDKKGLLQAVIEQIDNEMMERLKKRKNRSQDAWLAFIDDNVAYIEMTLEPDIQRILLLDGPSVLGDPSQWPMQNECLVRTTAHIQKMIEDKIIKKVDAEAAARLINGAALTASLWIAASEKPRLVLPKAVEAFRMLANGLVNKSS